MSSKTILIVDDDPDVREAVGDALSFDGLQVELAGNGQEAIDLLNTVPAEGDVPDLILLDLTMPVMNGKEFLLELRKINRLAKIPVLVFSAQDDAPQVASSLRAVGWVAKPMRMEALLGAVHASLDARSALTGRA